MEKKPPCSAYKETRGLLFFARMLDKIRLQDAEQLHPDYFENLGQGFDGRCCRFLGVGYPVVRERTLASSQECC